MIENLSTQTKPESMQNQNIDGPRVEDSEFDKNMTIIRKILKESSFDTLPPLLIAPHNALMKSFEGEYGVLADFYKRNRVFSTEEINKKNYYFFLKKLEYYTADADKDRAKVNAFLAYLLKESGVFTPDANINAIVNKILNAKDMEDIYNTLDYFLFKGTVEERHMFAKALYQIKKAEEEAREETLKIAGKQNPVTAFFANYSEYLSKNDKLLLELEELRLKYSEQEIKEEIFRYLDEKPSKNKALYKELERIYRELTKEGYSKSKRDFFKEALFELKKEDIIDFQKKHNFLSKISYTVANTFSYENDKVLSPVEIVKFIMSKDTPLGFGELKLSVNSSERDVRKRVNHALDVYFEKIQNLLNKEISLYKEDKKVAEIVSHVQEVLQSEFLKLREILPRAVFLKLQIANLSSKYRLSRNEEVLLLRYQEELKGLMDSYDFSQYQELVEGISYADAEKRFEGVDYKLFNSVKAYEHFLYNKFTEKSGILEQLKDVKDFIEDLPNKKDPVIKEFLDVFYRGKVVDIEKNIKEKNYISFLTNETYLRKVADTDNIAILVDRLLSGNISKEAFIKDFHASISSETLPKRYKKVVGDILEKNLVLNPNKLEEELLKHGVLSKNENINNERFNDYIMERTAYKILKLEKMRPTTFFKNIFGFDSRRNIAFMDCLSEASEPLIKSHTKASEFKRCVDEYNKELEKKSENLERLYGNQYVAASGLGVLFLVLDVHNQAMKSIVRRAISKEMERRIKAIDVIHMSDDKLEQFFNFMKIKTKDEKITSLALGGIDEAQTAKALQYYSAHTVDVEFSKDKDFKKTIEQLNISQLENERRKTFLEYLERTLGKNDEFKRAFDEFLENTLEKRKKEYKTLLKKTEREIFFIREDIEEKKRRLKEEGEKLKELARQIKKKQANGTLTKKDMEEFEIAKGRLLELKKELKSDMERLDEQIEENDKIKKEFFGGSAIITMRHLQEMTKGMSDKEKEKIYAKYGVGYPPSKEEMGRPYLIKTVFTERNTKKNYVMQAKYLMKFFNDFYDYLDNKPHSGIKERFSKTEYKKEAYKIKKATLAYTLNNLSELFGYDNKKAFTFLYRFAKEEIEDNSSLRVFSVPIKENEKDYDVRNIAIDKTALKKSESLQKIYDYLTILEKALQYGISMDSGKILLYDKRTGNLEIYNSMEEAMKNLRVYAEEELLRDNKINSLESLERIKRISPEKYEMLKRYREMEIEEYMENLKKELIIERIGVLVNEINSLAGKDLFLDPNISKVYNIDKKVYTPQLNIKQIGKRLENLMEQAEESVKHFYDKIEEKAEEYKNSFRM